MPARQETTNDDATVSPLLSALPTVHGRVVARRRLTEDLLEVTLAGFGAVDGRPWVDRLTGGDQFVFALVSPEPGGIRPGYRLADLLERRPADPVRGAYYTVRCSRPGADELDLWVVDHGAPGSVGEWMSSASGGDAVALWGPRCGFRIPEDARRVLFVADETGLAAVGALIDQLPDDARATAVIECRGDAHRPCVPPHPGLDLRWVDRGDDAPGTVNRLLPAVGSLMASSLDAGFDAGFDAVFGAAESRHVTEIRRFLRPLGLGADRSMLTGYWRREVG